MNTTYSFNQTTTNTEHLLTIRDQVLPFYSSAGAVPLNLYTIAKPFKPCPQGPPVLKVLHVTLLLHIWLKWSISVMFYRGLTQIGWFKSGVRQQGKTCWTRSPRGSQPFLKNKGCKSKCEGWFPLFPERLHQKSSLPYWIQLQITMHTLKDRGFFFFFFFPFSR